MIINTFNMLCDNLIELRELASQKTLQGEAAQKLLEKDPTTHNVEELQKFIAQYSRNR